MDALYLAVPLAMLCGAGALYGARYLSAASVLLRKIQRTPRRHIGEVRTGEIARVTGRVQSLTDPLGAPISLRKCAYYEAIVDSAVQGGPVQLAHEIRGHAFLVRDGSGVALVDPRGAAVAVTHDVAGEFGSAVSSSELPDEVQAFLQRHDVTMSKTKTMFSPIIMWREGIFAEGELVTVIGLCHWEDAGGAGYRGDGEKRLVVTAPPGEKLMLTDDREVVLAPGR
jgi:hypothetical protein